MHVYADRVVHTIVPVPEAPEVSGFGLDVVPLVEALSPEERLRHGQPQGLGLQPWSPGLTPIRVAGPVAG